MIRKMIAFHAALVALCVAGPAWAGQHGSSKGPHGVGLVKTVLESASKYRNLETALDDGYLPASGCTSGPNGGAMGVHYARFDLIGDGVLDATRPEILVYEPTRAGWLRLVAVEYVVIKEAWEAINGLDVPPILSGQHMMIVGAPNRYTLPPHYMLHVWAFKRNISGMFAANNPTVRCDFFDPEAI